jgi:HEAT repeat protein
VRHEAIKALGKIKDVKAVEPLIERFSEDGFQVEAALKDMGPIAEPALITRLRDRSADVRRKVCKVLEEIGGKDTLKAMDALPQDPDLGTRMAAANAYKQILARVGPASRGSKSRIPAGTR